MSRNLEISSKCCGEVAKNTILCKLHKVSKCLSPMGSNADETTRICRLRLSYPRDEWLYPVHPGFLLSFSTEV